MQIIDVLETDSDASISPVGYLTALITILSDASWPSDRPRWGAVVIIIIIHRIMFIVLSS